MNGSAVFVDLTDSTSSVADRVFVGDSSNDVVVIDDVLFDDDVSSDAVMLKNTDSKVPNIQVEPGGRADILILSDSEPETDKINRDNRDNDDDVMCIGVGSDLGDTLKGMGFGDEDISYALKRCRSVNAAVKLLLSSPDSPEMERVFKCPICLCEHCVSDMVTLSCLHRLCTECFAGYCGSKILEGEVRQSELCCPCDMASTTPSPSGICGQPITIHEIKAHVSTDVFSRYETFLTRTVCEDEQWRSCPKCNDWYVDIASGGGLLDESIWRKVECGKCNHFFCGKCGLVPHKGQPDQDISCEAMSAWIQANEMGDGSLQEYMTSHNLFPCPHCGMPGELSQGCKFLHCRCKGRYCALCGCALSAKQHFSHFQGAPGCTGPFGNKCKGVTDASKVSQRSQQQSTLNQVKPKHINANVAPRLPQPPQRKRKFQNK